MLVITFVVTSIIISVSYASEENNDIITNNLEYPVNEASSCDVKMSNIYSKLDLLRKKNNDLEDIVLEKFHKLEKNILGKLEEYIGDKLDSAEKNSNRKVDSLVTNTNRNIDLMGNNLQRRIDAMEKNVPDKIDILTLIQKFDGLKKMKRSDVNLIYESQTSANNTSLNSEEIKPKLKVPDFDINIKHNIEAFVKNNSEYLDKNIDSKLGVLESTILEKIKSSLRNSTTSNMTIEIAEESSQKKNILWGRSEDSCVCKKRVINAYDYQPMSMDNNTFNHVTADFKEDDLIRFEMRLAIKSTGLAIIQLASLPSPGEVHKEYFTIVVGDASQSKTFLCRTFQLNNDGSQISFKTTLQTVSTPGVITRTNVTSFYVKIEHETLEFGRTGNVPPIIRYKDPLFNKVKYIGLTSYPNTKTSFLYDCPPSFEDMLNL